MPDVFSSEKIDWFWRVSLAQFFIFCLFMLGLVSFSIPMSEKIRPLFFLIAIYYWAIYRPGMIHPFFIFVYGIVFDLVLGFPVGIHALLFLTVQWIIKTQGVFFTGQTYLVVWLGFAVTVLSVLTAEWLFFSVFAGTLMGVTTMLISFVMTCLLYPLITAIFMMIHRILPVTQKPYF